MERELVLPRVTPDRDSRYMGQAWIQASFSKDPNTQVGATIVGVGNRPLGSGYNGPPREIEDHAFSWCRPSKDHPDEFSKYDTIIHAEMNAIRFSDESKLRRSTLYVTALPCPDCMLEIVYRKIRRVVYFDFVSTPGSMMQLGSNKEKTFHLATLGKVTMDCFAGDLRWVQEWFDQLQQKGVLPDK